MTLATGTNGCSNQQIFEVCLFGCKIFSLIVFSVLGCHSQFFFLKAFVVVWFALQIFFRKYVSPVIRVALVRVVQIDEEVMSKVYRSVGVCGEERFEESSCGRKIFYALKKCKPLY